MSAIVTCNEVGNSLTHWLKLASDIEKKALLNELLSELKSCSEESLDADQYLATCEDLDEAIKKATEKIKADVNNGLDLPKDATDCSRPVTICGVNNLLNDAKNNDTKEAVANVIKSKATDDAEFRQVFVNTLISKAAGNRIEMRKDGIGVWDAAPPNLASQYVDAINGDDKAAGTRAAPLRTTYEAMRRIRNAGGIGVYHIYFKAAQTHVIDKGLPGVANAQLKLRVYDHQYEPKSNGTACGAFYPHVSADFPRPTLLFAPISTDLGTRKTRFYALNFEAHGIIFREAEGYTHYASHLDQFITLVSGSGNECGGCEFYLTKGVVFGGQQMRFYGSTIDYGTSGRLVYTAWSHPNIRVDDDSGGQIVACHGDPTLTYTSRKTEFRKATTLETLGAQYSIPHRQLYTASVNWDIFAGVPGAGPAPTTPTTPVAPSKQDIAEAVKQALSELISSEAGNALRVDSNGKLFVPTPSNNDGSTGGSTTPSRPTEGRGSHFTSRIEVQTGTSGGDAAHGWKRTTNTVTVNLRNLEPNAEYFIKLNTSLFKFIANKEGNYSVTGSSSQTVKDSSFVNPTVSGSAADTTAAHNAFTAARAGRVGGEHVQNYSAAAQFTLFKADGTELMIVPKTSLA